MADQLTADDVHLHVHELRARAVDTPERIELGKQQIAALEQAARDSTGLADVGPLTQFQGMTIIKSRRDDHVKLLKAGEEGEAVEVEFVQPVVSEPLTAEQMAQQPADQEQSG